MQNNQSMPSDQHGVAHAGGLGGQHLGIPGSTHHSHNPHHAGQDGRINHSSPSKPLATGGGIMNSQAGVSIQGSSAGGISGMSTTNGGARPTMTQTSHGKNFPYSMHRKTNSNKLPHIGSSSGKEGTTNQSIQ